MTGPKPRMTTCLHLAVAAAVMGVLPTSPVAAQSLLWVDACEVPGTSVSMRKSIDAAVAIVDPDEVHDNFDGTFSVDAGNFLALHGTSLAATSLFHNETTYVPVGFYRSGLLVAPNKVVTAPHQAVSLVGFKVLFGIENQAGTCLPFDHTAIPTNDVFTVIGYNRPNALDDYAILTLDRPVTARPFLRLRREGQANPGNAATIVGHPGRLPTRLDAAGEVDSVIDGRPYYQRLHTTQFSSGAPVFNLDEQFVETIVIGGESCEEIVCTARDTNGICSEIELSSECPAMPFYINLLPAAAIAAHVPPVELLVAPLDTVKQSHRTGPITVPVTTYTLTAPKHAGAAATIEYEIVPSAPVPTGEPWLSIAAGTPLTGTLAAGDSLAFDVTTMKPTDPASCEIYERQFLVLDKTHGFTDVVRQRVEVGFNGFTINGDNKNPLVLDGIEQPYADEATLAVHNPHMTAIAIHIEADRHWIRLDGTDGTATTFAYLNIIVNPGETRNIPVGLSPEALALTADGTTYRAQLHLSTLGTSCTLTPTTSIRIDFTPGQLTVTQPINLPVADAIGGTPGTPLTSSIEVEEDFCIDEVIASYDVSTADYPGPTARQWFAESSWRMARPASLSTIPLWNLNTPAAGVTDTPVPCHADAGEKCFRLAVGTMAPAPAPPTDCSFFSPPCEELADVIGIAGRGTWSMAIRDHDATGVAQQPLVRDWRLVFRGHPGCTVP